MSTPLTILSLIPTVLRTLDAAVTAWRDSPVIHSILGAIANLVERGEDGAVELSALNDQITAMVSANRDPTDEEWAALKARSDAAHAGIQGTSETTPDSISGGGTASEPATSPSSS